MKDVNLFDFEWAVDRDGYEIEIEKRNTQNRGAAAKLLNDGDWLSIKRKGGPLRYYRPSEEAVGIHRMFASLDGSENSFLKFVSEYGFLGSSNFVKADAEKEYLSNIIEVHSYAQQMMNIIDNLFSDPKLASAFFTDHISPNMKLGINSANPHIPVLQIMPITLASFIWLNFAQEITDGREWKLCLNCPKWFTFGKGTGARSDKQYCSTKCRVTYNRIQKEKEKASNG